MQYGIQIGNGKRKVACVVRLTSLLSLQDRQTTQAIAFKLLKYNSQFMAISFSFLVIEHCWENRVTENSKGENHLMAHPVVSVVSR